VHDPIISAYIGQNNVGAIDLDAFLHRCRHCILNDISIRVTPRCNFFFSQGCLVDVRLHSEALSLQGFEKDVIKHVISRKEPWHDMILEQFGQFAWVTQEIVLLIYGQLVEGGIGGYKDGEWAWTAQRLGKLTNGIEALGKLVGSTFSASGLKDVSHVMFLLFLLFKHGVCKTWQSSTKVLQRVWTRQRMRTALRALCTRVPLQQCPINATRHDARTFQA